VTTATTPLYTRLGHHWFIPAALLILSGAIVATQTADWASEALLLEGALIFDLGVLLPLLFWVCYRVKANAAVLRSVAIACGGIWLSTHLVPSEHQSLLPFVAFLRYGAIALLVYIEIRIVAALYWSVVLGRVPADQAAAHLSREAGIPDALAALMAKEAMFWKFVLAKPLAFIRRHMNRRDRF
jgi:hypothetical protein